MSIVNALISHFDIYVVLKTYISVNRIGLMPDSAVFTLSQLANNSFVISYRCSLLFL
jgi:hypothetical protein